MVTARPTYPNTGEDAELENEPVRHTRIVNFGIPFVLIELSKRPY
jgi:hypothetical protein